MQSYKKILFYHLFETFVFQTASHSSACVRWDNCWPPQFSTCVVFALRESSVAWHSAGNNNTLILKAKLTQGGSALAFCVGAY